VRFWPLHGFWLRSKSRFRAKLRVWWKQKGLNVNVSFHNPQKTKGTPFGHDASFKLSCVKSWGVTSTGVFEKGTYKYIKVFLLYFIHLHSKYIWVICTKFGTAVGVADVITCDKFFGDRLRSVDSVGGRNLLLIRPVAVNTGLALLCSPWLSHVIDLWFNN